MYSLLQDLRYAFRSLRKRPGFTLMAVLTLSLGIGATTAIFSVVHNTMWRTLPVPGADRLVSIVTQSSSGRFFGPVSFPDYKDYRELDVFEDLAANITAMAELTTNDVPERVVLTLTSGSYFELLEMGSAHGRFYTEAEGDFGGESVIVLSHRYWQRRFGGDPAIVGSTLTLNNLPVTVLGVTPEEFNGTIGFAETNAYIPVNVWAQVRPKFQESTEDRTNLSWRLLGRLAQGVEIEEASAAVASRAATLEKEYPESNANLRALVFPEPLTRLEPSAAAYMPIISPIFMSMVTLVLLIACANVASLLLAYAADRKGEVALRSALGAARWRIARQLVTESTVLALLGGIVGLGVARWATVTLANVRVASDIPLFFDFSIDGRVFLFAVGLTILAGALAGLAPGVQSSRVNLADSLKQGGRGSSAGRQPLRSILVAAQVAVSLVLLVCTALFAQSMWNVSESNPGFAMDGRFMLTVSTGLRNYEPEKSLAFFRELLGSVRNVSAVESAALGSSVPVGFNSEVSRVSLPGEGEAAGQEATERIVMRNIVTAGYFDTMGVDVLEGRAINERDSAESRPVAVINQRMAELWWPEGGAIGKSFLSDGKVDSPFQIVGIARTGYYSVPGESPQPHFWTSYEQDQRSMMTLFVHSNTPLEGVLPEIRRLVSQLDPGMPLIEIRTLRSHYVEGKAAILFGVPTAMVGAFSLIGLVLAVTGLFGVISYTVSQRTREIGIRLALGATRRSVLSLLSAKGLILAGAGVTIGSLAALVLTRGLVSILIGVSNDDPVTYFAVAAGVLAIAALASYVPARVRLARIRPIDALRLQ